MIERLAFSQREEVMEVLRNAFASHPMFAPGTPLETVEAMLALLLATFQAPGRSHLFVMRREGRPACVAYATDPRCEPKWPAMAVFFYRAARIMGLRVMFDFINAFSKRPKYEKPYLELFLLGTAPEAQKLGMGRAMLNHLYELCLREGYAGLILGAATDTPAFRFYEKEGFVTDSVVPFQNIAIANMRRDNR